MTNGEWALLIWGALVLSALLAGGYLRKGGGYFDGDRVSREEDICEEAKYENWQGPWQV